MSDQNQEPVLTSQPSQPSQSQTLLEPSPALQEWESKAHEWLLTLPKRRNVTTNDMEAWIGSNQVVLPDELRSLPRSQLYQRIISIHNLIRRSNQAGDTNWVDPAQSRFQRTDKWKPIYSWLESLDTTEVVKSKDIVDWFSENPAVKDQLYSRHSRYHLMHYIQKCHAKLLRKRQKLQKLSETAEPSINATPIKAFNDGLTTLSAVVPSSSLSNNGVGTDEISLSRKNDAYLKYELLSDLQNHLTSLLLKHKQVISSNGSLSPSLVRQRSAENSNHRLFDAGDEDGSTMIKSRGSPHSQDAGGFSFDGQSRPGFSLDMRTGGKRKRTMEFTGVMTHAWSHCEASYDVFPTEQPSSSHCEEATTKDCWKNIIMCLKGRERGFSWPLACSHSGYVGKHQEKWKPFLEGWKSLGRQFMGPAVWFERKAYSSWVPTWCAYTSSMAVAQPLGRLDQGVQKVLDVRFHPNGLAQLVCSSNEAPNELLLYNLIAGRATELAGHNCQIQAVEYAMEGASIVSCGANLLKVWDSMTGACLFTLGPVGDDRATLGHVKKIHAMTVNRWQSCLVVTSGGEGDGKLLLWNALSGELAADLNINLRAKDQVLPSIDAMEFCNQNLLVCGSDSAYGGPAIVQLWDIETPQNFLSFPANDSYITSLKINPACNTIITGAGDGTIGLFDIRTCGGISRLSVGSSFEVTSVSFSSCGTYFHASSTGNNTLVWDTRLMPMNHGQMPSEKPLPVNGFPSMRPLHCLSHGKPMPTAEHAGQLPGYVDEGDQGVNDARWLHEEPVLVTVSGNGSIAMWDVNLGQPCIRHLSNHTRCANTVAVAPNDEYICSGGDDQKVVLYHDSRGKTCTKWRLIHPLAEMD